MHGGREEDSTILSMTTSMNLMQFNDVLSQQPEEQPESITGKIWSNHPSLFTCNV